MVVPLLFDKPLNVWLGIILLFLLTFQVLTGRRWIKTPFVYHRRNGMIIVVVAALHAYYGLGICSLAFTLENKYMDCAFDN